MYTFLEGTAMVRMSRAEVFDPDEVAIAHVFSHTVRRCFLFGEDPITGKNFDHRKVWIEDQNSTRFVTSR